MSDQRLLFRKEGRAVYISHLDLMRTFQRAFKRAGFDIRHTGKYSPHPFISIAVPLSLGYSSSCELVDFGMDNHEYSNEEVPALLNRVLPEGIIIEKCYDATRAAKEIHWVRWQLELLYDNGVPEACIKRIAELYSRETLLVQKKSKKAKSGFTTVDVIPLVKNMKCKEGSSSITIDVWLAAQNPGLNPSLFSETIGNKYPDLRPDFVRASRLDIFDEAGECFEENERAM